MRKQKENCGCPNYVPFALHKLGNANSRFLKDKWHPKSLILLMELMPCASLARTFLPVSILNTKEYFNCPSRSSFVHHKSKCTNSNNHYINKSHALFCSRVGEGPRGNAVKQQIQVIAVSCLSINQCGSCGKMRNNLSCKIILSRRRQ